MIKRIKYNLGWVPDIPDARDLKYKAPIKVMRKLPTQVSLRSICPPVYNQGILGSCTANAVGASFEVLKKKQEKPVFTPSRLFLYYNTRSFHNEEKVDSGAYLRDTIKSIVKQGVCDEALWPYSDNDSRFKKKPPKKCYTQALKNQVLSYQRIKHNLNAFKGCLAEGFPFVFGFSTYDNFDKNQVKRRGRLTVPNLKKESLTGGHAVMAIGYNDSKKMFLIQNSFGKNWGLSGYFWMSYNYLCNDELADDFWTLRLVE